MNVSGSPAPCNGKQLSVRDSEGAVGKRMSLHTFLPSSTEVLSLPCAVMTVRRTLVLLWIRLCGPPQIRDC